MGLVESDDTVPGRERTTEDGRISLNGIGPRTWRVSLGVPDFLSVIKTLVPPRGSTIDLGDFTLDPGIELRGRLTDLTGKPVPGAKVGSVTTDENGAFRVEHLPAGPLTLFLHGIGVARTEQVVDVRPGAEPVVVALAAGALVRVVARRDGGEFADKGLLTAVRISADGYPDTTTRKWRHATEDGRFTWRLPAGRWHVFWGSPPYDESSANERLLAEWVLAEGETKDAELTLPAR